MAYSKLIEKLEISIAEALYDEHYNKLSAVEKSDVDRFIHKYIMKVAVPYIERTYRRKDEQS